MLVCLVLSLEGSAQKLLFGLEMTSPLMQSSVEFCVSYSFATHWSLMASSAFNFAKILPAVSDEQVSNEEALGIERFRSDDSDDYYQKLMCIYYLGEGNKGFYLNLGGRYGNATGADVIIGAGYSIALWKCLRLCMGLEFRAIQMARKKSFLNDELKVALMFRF